MEKRVLAVSPISGDIIGNTDFPIQAAVDYLSYIGGGTVKIGEGIYTVNTSINLRSNVILEGVPGKTILRKCDNFTMPLIDDADKHERHITPRNAERFGPGQMVAVKIPGKDNGFDDTVAIITGREGNTCYLDRQIYRNNLIEENIAVELSFPVISGYNCNNAEIRNIMIDGNKQNNSFVGGCRFGGIYLFESDCINIEGCTVHDYNGDGISYQGCNNIMLRKCECSANEGRGFHPGSGTRNTVIDSCTASHNKLDGIFFCYRVKDSLVENCISCNNGMSGLSIGHKDTHNTIRNSSFSENKYYGIFFRNEHELASANFNIVENNIIKENGSRETGDVMGYAGIRIRGCTNHVKFINNKIIFEKMPADKTVGICREEATHDNIFEGNEFINCYRDYHHHWIVEESKVKDGGL